MSKHVRKIVNVLNLILLVMLISAAIPFICFARGEGVQTPVAVADEGQIEIDDPDDQSMIFNGDPWTAENVDRERFQYKKFLKKIFDSEGNVVSEEEAFVTHDDGTGNTVKEPGAKDAGEYTVTVIPAENCVWRSDGGTGEKTFQLTIEKAHLEWWYKEPNSTDHADLAGKINEEAYAETSYWRAPDPNRIEHVWAFLGSIKYSKEKNYNNLTIIKDSGTDKESTRDSQVIDVGTYDFTVSDESNYENPTFRLVIKPLSLNLAEKLAWVRGRSGHNELNLGAAYEYSYNVTDSGEVKKFYSASELAKAPYSDWENWTAVSSSNPNERSLVSYCEGVNNIIKLYLDSGSDAYFNAEYTDNEASELGSYKATAIVKPIANYSLYFDLEAAGKTESDLGMTVRKNDDGTYLVTKDWYVVQYFNEYMDRSSAESRDKDEYVFPTGWTFGKLPEGGIYAPCVAHGDEILSGVSRYEQPNGYKLDVDLILAFTVIESTDEEGNPILDENGEQLLTIKYYDDGWRDGSKDIVTFTIMRGDTLICRDQPRSRFSYYINEYTPVGVYTITFNTKLVTLYGAHVDWWLGNSSNCGNAYMGTTLSFDFEVTADTCIYDDLDVNFKDNDQMKPYEVDFGSIKGDYNNFFGVTAGKTFVEGAFSKQTIVNSNTYWAEVFDDYFDEKPYLTFSLVIEDAEYLPASAEEWAALIAGADTYRIYYQINLRNYESEAVADGGKYFDIILYEVLEIPEFVVVEYTGEAQTVTPAEEDARYTIEDNVQTAIGTYEATLTLLDNVHYRWKGIEGAVCKVNYIIDKATNRWLTNPNLADYQWNSFDRTINLIAAKPLVFSPVFGVTYDAEGLNYVASLESFTAENGVVSAEAEAAFNKLKAGTYYLWCFVLETDTHKEIEKAAYEFTVELADNGWIAEPDIKSWSDSQTPKYPTATPKYGTVTFKIVAEDDMDDVYYDSVSGLNRLVGMKAGSYVLIASVEGTTDTYKGIQFSKTFLIYNSLNDVVIILLCVLIALLVCAVVVLVILMLYYKRKKGGHDGDGTPHGGNGGGGHTPEGHNTEHHEGAEHDGESDAQQISIMHVLEANNEAEHAHNKENIGEEPAVEESVGEQPEIKAAEVAEEVEPEIEPEEDEPEVEKFEETEPEVEEVEPEVEPVEEPVYEQPTAQPAAQQPVYGQPMYDMYGRPMYDIYGRPIYQQPVYNQPVAQPVYNQPVEEEPEIEEVVPEADEPFEEQSVSEAPAEEEAETAEEQLETEQEDAEEAVEAQPEAEQEEAETAVQEPVEEEIAPPVFDEPVEEQPASEEPAEQAEEIAPPVFDEPAEEQAPAEEPEVEEQSAEEEPEIAPPVFDEPAEESKPEDGEQPDDGEQD